MCLDRMFFNIQWRLCFQDGMVFHLPKFKSAHRCILVRMTKEAPLNRHRRPFRFLASWLSHEDFPRVMAQNWLNDLCWNDKVHKLQNALREWNCDVFGNIFKRKKRLLKRLDKISGKMVGNFSLRLQFTHDKIWREYEEVLVQEEVLWYQKSRSKWLLFGDRNIRYFHGVTTIRRMKNRYEALQDDNRLWIEDPVELESLVTIFFKNLFTEDTQASAFVLRGAFPALDEETLNSLRRGITKEDIWWAIKDMGAFKAPGVDGLQVGFYQTQCHIVGDTVCKLIMEAFENPCKIEA